MREQLIAYALGELDEAECRRIEQVLSESEALRDELEQIVRCLSNDDCPDLDDEVPSDLADRTTAGILSGCWSNAEQLAASSRGSFRAVACFMSPLDMTVALGVLVTIASLLTPALYNSRNHAQRVACTNNLQQLGQLMQMYADGNPRHFFPVVRPNEHAGIFAPRLREADFVRPDLLDDIMLCSSSPLATRLAEEGRAFHVPSMAELSLAKGMWRIELQRTSSGNYGYQAGYLKGNYYLPMKNFGNSKVPVVADAPSVVDNHRVTANHDGKVVNALFQDGSVLSLDSPQVPCSNDPLYFNDQGETAVGTHWNDAVVLPSGTAPVLETRPMPEPVHRIFLHIR